MSNNRDFIREYGDISFREKPFCDADNIAICQMFYMPLEKVAPNGFNDEPMAFDEACRRMYAYNGNRHKAPGLVLPKKISVLLMEMSETRRYSEMKIVACTEVFSEKPALQFGAATLLLPDGTIVVVFRGTDDTLTGWKEDVDLYTKKGVPSHKLAMEYLNNVGKNFDGDIIVCGHSKGGNVALYGAIHCEEEVRDRIQFLYNNDGPGFHTYDYINSKAYKDLLPRYRHFVPDCSLVGILLAHDDDYIPIKSSRLLGPMQHDLSTWQIKGTMLVPKEDLKFLAKLTDAFLYNGIFNVPDDDINILDRLIDLIFESTGANGLLDLVGNIIPSVKGVVKALGDVDDETKSALKRAVKGMPELLKDTFEDVRRDKIPEAVNKLKAAVGA